MPPLEHLPSSLSCALHCNLSHQLWADQQELEKVSELKARLNLWPRRSSDHKLFPLLSLLLGEVCFRKFPLHCLMLLLGTRQPLGTWCSSMGRKGHFLDLLLWDLEKSHVLRHRGCL